MSKIDEAFERYCTRDGISSEQYKGDIKPAFEAGYTAGFRSSGAEVQKLREQVERLERQMMQKDQQISDYGWQTNPDRMGS